MRRTSITVYTRWDILPSNSKRSSLLPSVNVKPSMQTNAVFDLEHLHLCVLSCCIERLSRAASDAISSGKWRFLLFLWLWQSHRRGLWLRPPRSLSRPQKPVHTFYQELMAGLSLMSLFEPAVTWGGLFRNKQTLTGKVKRDACRFVSKFNLSFRMR